MSTPFVDVSSTPRHDSDVLARARSGDRSAFGELVQRYQRRVYSTALHITGSHHDADDVTQEAFIRAYRGIDSFDGRSELFTWLYRITVNTALNYLRSQQRVANIAQAGAAHVSAEGGRLEALGIRERTPCERLELDRHCRQVLSVMAALSPGLRITLVLATVEGKSYREIAGILGVPEGTVAWRVNEARRQLKQRLEAAIPVEDQKP